MKNSNEKIGRDFAPECGFEVCRSDDNRGWVACIEIGDCYYETDPYTNKQGAIDEQCGCLLAIKEQIEKYLETLTEE